MYIIDLTESNHNKQQTDQKNQAHSTKRAIEATVIGGENNRVREEVKRQRGKDGVSSATLAGRLPAGILPTRVRDIGVCGSRGGLRRLR